MAVISGGIAWVTLRLSKKSKHQDQQLEKLTGIVEQLTKQSEIMNARYELEKELAEPNIPTRFKINGEMYRHGGSEQFNILNLGANAFEVSIVQTSVGIKATISTDTIKKDDYATIAISFSDRWTDDYWIVVHSQNKTGKRFRQQITRKDTGLQIGNPNPA